MNGVGIITCFYMQPSDSVKNYFFEVTGKERIQARFAKIDSYRLQQTCKKDRTLIIWFAPEVNYQLVKFRYEYNRIDLSGILIEHSATDSKCSKQVSTHID